MSNVEINPNREYILIGDISMSMTTTDPACANMTRYEYMLEKFKLFIKAAEDFDPHGPSIILFGEQCYVYPKTTLSELEKKFELKNITFEGFTNLDLALQMAYRIHKDEKADCASEGKIHPGTICLVFTDGEPTNRLAVEKIILQIANEIDREEEFNILLLTVGSRSEELQKYLDSLHDKLEQNNKRDFDILHIEKLEGVSFLKAVEKAKHQ